MCSNCLLLTRRAKEILSNRLVSSTYKREGSLMNATSFHLLQIFNLGSWELSHCSNLQPPHAKISFSPLPKLLLPVGSRVYITGKLKQYCM